jgi:proton-dependent oligopeptide transporter, POT family
LYGAWGALITIYGLIGGNLVDQMGVAISLRVGFVLTLIARSMIFITTNRTILLWQILLILPAGNCLGVPVLTTGIRRYTTIANRGFAFGLFYVIMNVAALFSGPVVDFCTIWYNTTTTTSTTTSHNESDNDVAASDNEPNADGTTTRAVIWKLSGYRLVILTGVMANAIAVLVAFTVREIKLVEQQQRDEENEEEDQQGHGSAAASSATTMTTTTIAPFTPTTSRNSGGVTAMWRETICARRFWRFLAVCLITLNVRMIFRHLDATLPKYLVREFGDRVPKGTIYSINPALIVVLVPIVTAVTSHITPLTMIHCGSYVSALSVFLLVVSTSIWSSVAFVTLLSIGESIWSPRLYDYTMQVCREGREGTYMALSSAPLFLAMLPVGSMSGYLLEHYCPETGPRDSKMMWFIIGATTISSPVLMTIFWSYISYDDDQDDATVELAHLEYREVATTGAEKQPDGHHGPYEENVVVVTAVG